MNHYARQSATRLSTTASVRNAPNVPTCPHLHLQFADEKSIRRLGVNDELGGSHRVDLEEVRRLLAESGEYYSRAGGSAANTTRGLAGFGVRVRLVSVAESGNVRVHSTLCRVICKSTSALPIGTRKRAYRSLPMCQAT